MLASLLHAYYFLKKFTPYDTTRLLKSTKSVGLHAYSILHYYLIEQSKRGIISPPPLYFAGHSTRKKFVEKSPEKWQSLQLLTAYIYEKKREAFFFLVHTRREEGNVWLQFCFKWFKVLVSDEYQFPCSMTYI